MIKVVEGVLEKDTLADGTNYRFLFLTHFQGTLYKWFKDNMTVEHAISALQLAGSLAFMGLILARNCK